MSGLLFLDTETLGLDPMAPIWEIAAVRRDSDGTETSLHLFVSHDPSGWIDDLPEKFADDYRTRYRPDEAVTPDSAARQLCELAAGRPTLVGAVPSFDAERIARQMLEPLGIARPWHYHLIDIENLVAVFVAVTSGKPVVPWNSDELSREIGVDPDDFNRHTAMGDVRWAMAQWDTLETARRQVH